jgi:hypothetical protein
MVLPAMPTHTIVTGGDDADVASLVDSDAILYWCVARNKS